MVENEREYYFARAAEEWSIAEMTSDGCAKAVHLELAHRYADLADGKVQASLDSIDLG